MGPFQPGIFYGPVNSGPSMDSPVPPWATQCPHRCSWASQSLTGWVGAPEWGCWHPSETSPGAPPSTRVTSSGHPVTLGTFLGMLSWLSLALAWEQADRRSWVGMLGVSPGTPAHPRGSLPSFWEHHSALLWQFPCLTLSRGIFSFSSFPSCVHGSSSTQAGVSALSQPPQFLLTLPTPAAADWDCTEAFPRSWWCSDPLATPPGLGSPGSSASCQGVTENGTQSALCTQSAAHLRFPLSTRPAPAE